MNSYEYERIKNLRESLELPTSAMTDDELATLDLNETLTAEQVFRLKTLMISFRVAVKFRDYEGMYLYRNQIISLLGLVTPKDLIVGVEEK